MKKDIIVNDKKYKVKQLAVQGLVFRGFLGEVDYQNILKVILGCREVDGLERAENLEDIINGYAHLHNCDPYKDMLFAEIGGEVIAYCRVWWEVEGSGRWVGFHFGNVLPSWRRRGIGSYLLGFNEKRLSQVAMQLKESGHLPPDTFCSMDNFVSNTEIDRIHLLERSGYQAVRYSFSMVRPDLENIPDLPLPHGVEVRPVKTEHLRKIWEASNEAFRDHWGYIPEPWEEYERLQNDPDFDPSLYRVAWEGDQVAGMVLSFIDKDENNTYDRRRGYTENICVRKPWRRQGLAKALIARSLFALKERGMTSAGLGVDTENTSGALNLYKSMGYQVVKQGTIYRKPLRA